MAYFAEVLGQLQVLGFHSNLAFINHQIYIDISFLDAFAGETP